MDDRDFVHASAICELAKRELAAYLRAAGERLGCSDAVQAGNIWIETMGSLDWPGLGHATFFRFVTLLSLLKLTAHPGGFHNNTSQQPFTASKGEVYAEVG